MYIKNIKVIALASFLTLLTGCVGKSLKTIDAARGIPLNQLDHWQLNARIAIKTPKDNVSASLNWQKESTLFDFLVSGAFGATYAHLIQQENQASLEIPDTDKLFHHNAEILLQRTLGWDFPIDALSYWVKGLPSGKIGEQVSYDAQGKISKIQLGQWQIDFSKYRRYQGYLLPKMIKANHPEMSIRVVAKKWQFFE